MQEDTKLPTVAEVGAAAFSAYAAGLCVIPPLEDGSKRPMESWKAFQKRRPDLPQMQAWYSKQDRQGIGVITGRVSLNLECIEFDGVKEGYYNAYLGLKEAAEAAGLNDLIDRIERGYSEASPSGGIHWLYRCSEIEGNTKLASRLKEPEEMTPEEQARKTPPVQVLIETRGEGGFVILAPSHGKVHNSGRAYELRSGSFDSIVEITPEERKQLWRLARSLDQLPAKELQALPPTGEERTGKPGADFNQRARWGDILLPHGWTELYTEKNGTTHWRRPGKREGVSASTNHGGSDLFYCFSSSTPFDTERGYSKFAVYAILNHNGDFKDAAKRLAADGYGERNALVDVDVDEAIYRFSTTDTGNADLFAHMFGGRVLFDHSREQFYIWRTHRWEPDADGERFRMAVEVAKAWQHAGAAREGAAGGTLFKHGKALESVAKQKAMLEAAQSNIALSNRGQQWDMNPQLLGVANGVIDLATGELRPGRPTDLITMATDLTYQPDATCPRWEQYLREVFMDREDIIDFIHRAVGYSLTGSTREQVMFLCHGSGQNGKSIFLSILRSLGGGYATNIASDTIKKKRGGNENHPAEIAVLLGKRVVTCSETPEAAAIHDERIKSLVGGDIQTARFMRGNPFNFRPVLKLWLATNHLPRVDDDSEGFWRRMRLIPFERQFTAAERDNDLEEKLQAELPGILAWAVRGAQLWYESGLTMPTKVMMATFEYRESADPLSDFIAECCVLGETQRVLASDIYKRYLQWAQVNAMRPNETLSSNLFGRKIVLQNGGRITKSSSHGGIRSYVGIGLIPHEEWLQSRIEAREDVFGQNGGREDDLGHEVNEGAKLVSRGLNLKTGVNRPPVLRPPCVCLGRHGEDNSVCLGGRRWKDPEIDPDETWHCSVCHPPEG